MNGSEFSDVLSEYTHYTQKTHGKTPNPTFFPQRNSVALTKNMLASQIIDYVGTEIISSSGNQESVFLAESNLTEIESIISNDRSEKTFSPKSNLLINSWCYVSQIFINMVEVILQTPSSSLNNSIIVEKKITQ